MRLLLDTRLLLWALAEPDRLPVAMRAILEDPEHEVLFSAASIWEIAIKAGRGRLDFTIRPNVIAQAARQAGFQELPILADAAARAMELPLHHRDPFDRLLIAQAMAGPIRLFTADAMLPVYSELVTLVRS